MREPDALHGVRVVARPVAIDAAIAEGRVPTGAIVVRIAPDDAFVIGASGLSLDDPFAIIEAESAFVGWWLSSGEVAALAHHAEWPLPQRTVGVAQLAQGLIAGLPMKLWLDGGADRSLLMVSRGLAHEVTERLHEVVA